MTDILDDSYESDLTDEEHERLILMSEHAIAKPLSPPAQAVLAAYRSTHLSINNLAAALHAAADQLLAVQWNGQIPADTAHQIGINWARDALHTLANELESP
jgi:hypothetical protein